MVDAHADLREMKNEIAEIRHAGELGAGRHLGQQIEPHLHRARIGVGVRLGMIHRATSSPADSSFSSTPASAGWTVRAWWLESSKEALTSDRAVRWPSRTSPRRRRLPSTEG